MQEDDHFSTPPGHNISDTSQGAFEVLSFFCFLFESINPSLIHMLIHAGKYIQQLLSVSKKATRFSFRILALMCLYPVSSHINSQRAVSRLFTINSFLFFFF